MKISRSGMLILIQDLIPWLFSFITRPSCLGVHWVASCKHGPYPVPMSRYMSKHLKIYFWLIFPWFFPYVSMIGNIFPWFFPSVGEKSRPDLACFMLPGQTPHGHPMARKRSSTSAVRWRAPPAAVPSQIHGSCWAKRLTWNCWGLILW